MNVLAVLAGTALGLLFGKAIHDRFRSIAFKAIGLSTFIIGASMSISGLAKMGQTRLGDYAPLVLVGSLVVGALLGELIGIEYWLERFGEWLQELSYRIPWVVTAPKDAGDEPGEKGHTLVEGFVSASLLFCVGAMTVLGSIKDGLGDHSVLYLKSLLDGVAALFLSTTLGIGVGLSVIPVVIVQGGIAMMANQPMGASWFQTAALKLWVPGIVLGAVIYFGVRRVNTPYTIPGIMLGATALFYAIAWAMKLTAADLRLTGWLMEQYSSAETWQFPLSPALLSQVDWMVLLKSIPVLLPVALISVIGLLLNSSGMELIIKRDIDLNRELVSAGIGNLAAGLAGGLVGFPDISFSALNHMTGARRLVGVLAAMFLAATLVVGTSTVLFIPKFVFGSVLIYLGLELLGEWVVKAWSKFSRLDFTIIIVILLTLALRGVLEGVIVGLILAVLSFVVSYSRVSVIKFAFSGREYRSRVTRSPGEQGILDTHGDELYVLRLEGFIFFGTANGIFQRLRERVGTPGAEIRYCLFDFSKVTGIDSTGMLSFSRMLQWCQEQGISLALAGLPGPTREEFLRENASLPEEALHFFADADHGIEWCEGQIIAAHPTEHSTQRSIQEQLRDILGQDGVEKLTGHMACHEYPAGEYLIREGDAPDLIYFVESGRVTAQLETPGKNPVRLETINHGRIVGEIAFFLGRTRTASVVADEDSVVWSLSMQDLELMQSEDPEAANLFHRLSVILLSQRVMHLTQTVRALERS